MFADDYVLYQWATLTNQADASEVFSVGCKRTIGDDDTFVVDYFAQDAQSSTALYPAETNAEVWGLTWDAQAPDYKEDDEDHAWVGTNEHHELVGASDSDANKIYGCYVAMELPKIGRDPNDFGKVYDVVVGARLYESDSATTYTEIPSSSSSFEYPEPASYAVAEGAYALFASTMAALAVLFMAF